MPSGSCSMVPRIKFAIETVHHGPKEKIVPCDRGSWSKGKNLPHDCALWSQGTNLSSGLCFKVQRRNFSLGTVLQGPRETICLHDRAPWSKGDNMPLGPCSFVPRIPLASGPCSMAMRRKYVLENVLQCHKKKMCPWKCAPWFKKKTGP